MKPMISLILALFFPVLHLTAGANEDLLQSAMNKDLIKVKDALKAKANINAQDEKGYTALIWASANGDIQMVKHLLSNKANVHFKKEGNETALILAVKYPEIVKLLLSKGAKVNEAAEGGITPLIQAVKELSWAQQSKDIKLIEDIKKTIHVLLSHKADVNAQTLKGTTAVFEADFETIKLLVSKGAKVNIKENTAGWTLLMYACLGGRTELVEFLIKNKADVNLKDKYGETPLKLAEKNKFTKIVEMLKKAGAKE